MMSKALFVWNLLILGLLLVAKAAPEGNKLTTPTERFLQDSGDDSETEGDGCHCSQNNPCDACDRCDCDSDNECSGDLVCYQRDAGDPVPGCPNIGTGGKTDFCAAADEEDCFLDGLLDLPGEILDAILGLPGDILDAICFSGHTTVEVYGKGLVKMENLRVGDRILTSSKKYETVYAFAHNNPTRSAKFYQIYNEESNLPLEITADHMVFLQDKEAPVVASTVQVGDKLMTNSNGPSKVTKISTVERTGIYAPLTTGGTLLVNGVKASSYTSVGQQKQSNSILSDHRLIHMALSPYRMVCGGISNHFFCKPESYNKDGMPYYVKYGLQILHWMKNGNSGVVQALVFGAVVGVTGTFWSMELLFGATLAPLMVFLAAVAFKSYQSNKKNKAKAL